LVVPGTGTNSRVPGEGRRKNDDHPADISWPGRIVVGDGHAQLVDEALTQASSKGLAEADLSVRADRIWDATAVCSRPGTQPGWL
jgi:hypothetical protein